MQKKPVFYASPTARSGLAAALLTAALLFASCAHAVNTHGGEVGGSGSGSSGGSSGVRGGVTVGSRGGLSNGGAAPDIVIGANAASYEVDRSRSVDFAEQTGSSAAAGTTADASSGLGYVTVTPLPAGTLFTETQSNLDVTWTTYNVTVTINGTDFPVSFTAGDTRAVVIEKVPVGATLSASATIGVPENLGYPGNSLTAATAAPTTIQSGANTITMWVQYPLEFHVSTAHQTNASITGTQPAYYTNASATPLPETTATYTNVSTNKIMRFTGWAFENNGTPVITSTSIPPSIYKGKLSLYASYGECALHITGSGISAGTTPVIAADGSLALTAVAEGFPAGAAISYSWRIVPPAAPATAPATVSGSGASATVYPVAGAGGSATVEVTATSGALTASAMLNVDVQVALPDFTVQITPPASYNSAKSDESNPANPSFALTDAAAAFSFTPVPAPGKSFPAGTTFSWTVDASSPLAAGSAYSGDLSGTTAVGQAASAAITASGMAASAVGYTPANAASITVTCTAHHTHAPADKTTSAHASAFMLYTLPAFTIEVTPPSTYNADNSDTTSATKVYALKNASDAFRFTATPASPATSFPAGTTLTWKVYVDSTLKYSPAAVDAATYDYCQPTPVTLGMTYSTMGTSPADAKTITITCTASNEDAVVSSVDATDAVIKIFRLTVPVFKIEVTPPAGITSETSGTGASATTTYLFRTSDVTDTGKKFKLEAVPVNDTDSFPEGTKFAWKFSTAPDFTTPPSGNSGDDKIRNETAYAICNNENPDTSGASYMIECKPVLDGAALPPTNATTSIPMKMVLTVGDVSTVLADATMRTTFGITGSGTQADPYVLPSLYNITSGAMINLKRKLTNGFDSNTYIDLSNTVLPDTFTNLQGAFKGCTYLVKPPVIPDGVTNMTECFSGCTSLASAPVIPDGVTSIKKCFYGCTGLSGNVIIKTTSVPAVTDPDDTACPWYMTFAANGTGDTIPGITVYVASDAVKNDIQISRGNTGLAASGRILFKGTDFSDWP